MPWSDIDRSVHDLLGTVARLDAVSDTVRQRLLAELLDLDSMVHDELMRPEVVPRPTPTSREVRLGALLFVAILVVFLALAFVLGMRFQQWRAWY